MEEIQENFTIKGGDYLATGTDPPTQKEKVDYYKHYPLNRYHCCH